MISWFQHTTFKQKLRDVFVFVFGGVIGDASGVFEKLWSLVQGWLA